MNLMSVSQYAKHSGMSRQALYNWEAKQGFPARVDGKIDQEACDKYLSRYRDSHDPRIKNNASTVKHKSTRHNTLTKMSVAEIASSLRNAVNQSFIKMMMNVLSLPPKPWGCI